ncbi:MAG: hypothetical protein AB1454_06535 [Candidatus Auribacterota bacterium]
MSTLNISYRDEWNNELSESRTTMRRVRSMNIKATAISIRKLNKAEEYLEQRTNYAKYTETGRRAQRHNSAPEYLVLFG